MDDDILHLPVDARSEADLAARGLRMGIVDPADDGVLRPWYEAVSRGFLDAVTEDRVYEEARAAYADHRSTGVWDDTLDQPEQPVATITGWRMDLALPEARRVPSWAISAVTVAPTHRRRGIARAMVEAELRTAAAAGFPVAMLTVSEATIYGRFGFGPATRTADLTIEPRRAGWTGPAGSRIQFVDRTRIMADAPAILSRAWAGVPGAVQAYGRHRDRLFGTPTDDADLRARRFVRADDADGVPQGLLVYSIKAGDDFPSSTLTVRFLAAATDDAYAALWRFVLEHDLIRTVDAPLRSIDEPLLWMVRDPRAVRAEVRDHLWVRVLDPVAALTARTYAGPARFVLDIDDAQGHAAGRWSVDVAPDGTAEVTAAGSADRPVVAMDAAALGSMLLGGVTASTLARAGRVSASDPAAIAVVDGAFRSTVEPWLDIWF